MGNSEKARLRLAVLVVVLIAVLVAPMLLREATPTCATAMGELMCLPGTVVPGGKI
jgi:hypothetical protein